MTIDQAPEVAQVPVNRIRKNPNNPRRYFNEEKLDLLRTSIQEVGVLVPLIAYAVNDEEEPQYVLMDGERRWRCAIDLGLETVPTHIIERPSPLDNLVRMFNIHFTREDWPLISVALSLKEVMLLSGEERETRLAEMTGLTRATIRRAKRLLTIPAPELELIHAEAHLDRTLQVHREDLYLEIEAAVSVLRNALPEIEERFDRDATIRQFAKKREEGHLEAVTDFRNVGKFVKAIDAGMVDRETGVRVAADLIENVNVSPVEVFETTAAQAYEQMDISRKAELLTVQLRAWLEREAAATPELRQSLEVLRQLIDDHIARVEP